VQPLIAYVRVSRQGDREDEKFHSPTEQAERARAFAESKGFAVGEVLEDIDVSGAVHPRDRPGMARALDEVRQGRCGGLVAYSLDRLSRDPGHGDWLVSEVTSHGGIILAPDLPEDLDSPTGEFQFGVLLGVARLYRRTAAERLVLAKERAVRSGIFVSRVIPFGYTRDSARRMVIDPDTAPVVAELYELRIAGASRPELTRHLNERTGRNWSITTIRAMLANPIYRTGRIEQSGTISEFEAGAIVDSGTWYAAQSTVVRDERTSAGTWLCTGLLRCASCGKSLWPWKPARNRGHARRYRCAHSYCQDRVSVAALLVERLVIAEAFAADLKLIERQPESVDLGALAGDLAKAEARLAQMLEPASQDALGEAWVATAKARREERDAAARALGEARSLPGATSGNVLRLGHIWDDLEPSQQREVLRWVFAEVRVFKVPRGQPPNLTFVPRATRPWGSLALSPPEIVQTNA
jgi:DNA invertase Pin-like site-specific DNA recombinase